MTDRTTTLVSCWLVTLSDSSVLAFTDHDQDLTVSGQLYKAAVGYVPSAIQNTTELSPDNMDVTGIIDDAGIKEADLRAGKYDYARVKIFTVDWTNPAGGAVETLVNGRLGAVTLKHGMFSAELNNLAYQLQTNIGEVYATQCPADLGDSRCGINMDPADWAVATSYAVGDEVSPTSYNGRIFVCTTAGTSHASTEPTWNTTLDATTADGPDTLVWTCKEARTKQLTVTSVTDNLTFLDSARTEANGYFDGGLCTWLTGDNAGYSMDIKTYTLATVTIVLWEPMPFDIQIGDTATITVGCDKTIGTCKDTFDNIINFRAHPHVPGVQQLFG